jgi:diguanylate cyclase (GGDEF)-like protein
MVFKEKDIFKDVKKKIAELEPTIKKEVHLVFDNITDSLQDLYHSFTKDVKTGVPNYRYFKDAFKRQLKISKPGNLCLIILDIDFFKKINDTYGHLIGDKILEELTDNLQKSLRRKDLLARFGGEEFLVMLPETTSKKAYEIAERLRKNLPDSNLLKKYKITISLGLTCYYKKDNIEKMIKRADKSLYESKAKGRNQTTIFCPRK